MADSPDAIYGQNSGDADSGGSTKVGGVYLSSAPTLDTGDRGDLLLDVNGNLKITQATLLAGEDQTNNVLRVEQHFLFANVTSDTQVKSGAGFLHTVTFAQSDAAPTAGSIILYDNTAESGTVILTTNWTTGIFYPTTITIDAVFATGLYVGFTTTADINVTLSYR